MTTEQSVMPVAGYDEYAGQGAQSFEKMKEIRLCVDLTKKARAAGIPIGNFFIFDANVPQGEEPVMKDIGNEFLAIVLRDAQFLGHYDQEQGKYELTSTEFRSNVDPIILFDSTITDGREEIVACLPYTNKANPELSMKHLKDSKYTKLRMKYVAYLLYEGEVYKFGFAATDNTGCEPGEFKPLGFADADEQSFMHVKSRCHSEAGANVMFSHVLRIFSKPPFKGSVDFIKGFEISGRVSADRKEEIDQALGDMSEGLRGRFQRKTIKAWANTVDKEGIVCFDPRHIPFLVANPRIFTQQEKMPRLADGVIVPEIVAPAAAPRAPKEVSAKQSVQDAVEVFGEDESKPVPPDMSVKPRNRREALAQKKAEREYIKDSGIGQQAADDAEDMRLKKEQDTKIATDPGLASFMENTNVEKAKKTEEDVW